MPGSSSSGWRSPTSIASKASARRSRSARRTASEIRDRPSAPRPKFTTTCGCCSPASGGRSAVSAAKKSCAKRPRSWRGISLALPEGTRLLIGFEMPVVDPGGVLEGTDADSDEEDSRIREWDSGSGISVESRFDHRDDRGPSPEGVSSALRQRPDGDARRGDAGGTARSDEPEGHRRSREARRRHARAAHGFD